MEHRNFATLIASVSLIHENALCETFVWGREMVAVASQPTQREVGCPLTLTNEPRTSAKMACEGKSICSTSSTVIEVPSDASVIVKERRMWCRRQDA